MTGGQRVGKTARNPLGRLLAERPLPITSRAPIPLARKTTWRLRAGVPRDIGRRTRLIKIHMRTRIRQSHSRKFIVRPKGFAVTLAAAARTRVYEWWPSDGGKYLRVRRRRRNGRENRRRSCYYWYAVEKTPSYFIRTNTARCQILIGSLYIFPLHDVFYTLVRRIYFIAAR